MNKRIVKILEHNSLDMKIELKKKQIKIRDLRYKIEWLERDIDDLTENLSEMAEIFEKHSNVVISGTWREELGLDEPSYVTGNE